MGLTEYEELLDEAGKTSKDACGPGYFESRLCYGDSVARKAE
jgi:hypothetical protein